MQLLYVIVFIYAFNTLFLKFMNVQYFLIHYLFAPASIL